jgi:VWFA-related protein
MSDRTADGSLSATKTTKVTKITNNYWVYVIFVVFVIFVPARRPWAVAAAQQQPAPPTQAQQRPVFRGGTHFVRVDAYPTQDGKIVEGLRPEDFEVLEDGKRQAIESFDFIRFDTLTPVAERRDPSSQREGFDLAADPRYRLFVVYVDMTMTVSAAGFDDLPLIRQPLVNFFERIVGPQDLYGFLTNRNSVRDLVLAQKTGVTVSQIQDLWRAKVIDRDDADDVLWACPFNEGQIEMLKLRHRVEASYTNLEDLVRQLGSLRQERKNLVLVTNLLPRWRPDRELNESLVNVRGGAPPKVGIERGRITNDPREKVTNVPGAGDMNGCISEGQRLAMMDYDPRYRELLDAARRENVSFYVITPSGLQAPVSVGAQRAVTAAYDDLKSLADETDGIAVTDSNDLNAGFRRIADDLAAYYVLGYYTTNTKFDGGIRKIVVKDKRTGKTIRARRQYRAPTESEIAAMGNPAPAPVRAESGPPAVIGEPTAYRVTRAEGAQKLSLLEFTRTDRIRVQWPLLMPLDRRDARLLDSAGKPLPVDIPVTEDAAAKIATVEFALAPLSRGVYSIELTAGSGGKTEQRRLTFMMK